MLFDRGELSANFGAGAEAIKVERSKSLVLTHADKNDSVQ